MIDWVGPVLILIIGSVMMDLTLFGLSARVLGIGRTFAGPAAGERIVFDRKVGVGCGRLGTWGWNGLLVVTDQRIVSCLGIWS